MTQNELLDQYIVILSKWNKKINLVQEDTLNSAFERHIKDSLQIQNYLDKNDLIIDVGSGAGLPGIILAIQGFNVVLCEKSFKKCTFLRDVKSKLNLNCEIYNGDVFELKIPGDKKDKTVLVSRAFGSLSKLLEVMEKLNVSRGTFHKGVNYQAEIDEAKEKFDFKVTTDQSKTNRKSVILNISNVRRK